jgi:1-acyl-sn-glycerol-3-phosphate acyltransferase
LKVFLPVIGFNNYNKIKHSVYDYLPDYQPLQNTDKAAAVVSNHASFFEIFLYWQEHTSFLAKSACCDIPFLGVMPLSKQCVFLKSHN